MKSTFKVLFYVKKQSVKNGKAPVMGRITINGTQAGFSCKKEVSLALWDTSFLQLKPAWVPLMVIRPITGAFPFFTDCFFT